ncbi:VanZ family protein [Kitasatospora sp. NPDC050543]|uniref:VanZ family protein n=1 Tax=Kitasatospora sp. NPDC050543 TaxID=3364054 RepID=UPI0037A625C3
MRTENEPTRRVPAPPSAVGVSRPLRAAGIGTLILYLTVVGWLVLRPLPVAWVYDANLTPLASVRQALTFGGSAGLLQVAGELLLLAPLGVLLPLAGGRIRAPWLPSFLRVAGVSALLATGLEFLSSWAPGHVLNVDHILLGVAGVALAHLAVVPAARSLLRTRALPHPRPAPAPVPAQAPVPAPARTALPAAYGRPASRAR